MTKIVAVSGGVDSVVLLDMLVRSTDEILIVAHFDHGIRRDSAADSRFVDALAKQYGLESISRREELGSDASEAMARERRYAFLKDIAAKHDATLVTAHHADDVVESIAINISRGTGWRGLAVMNDTTIERPLLTKRKRDIYEYAMTHSLEWVEDETNSQDVYLRNRLRSRLGRMQDDSHEAVMALHQVQRRLANKIDHETTSHLSENGYSRYFFTMIDERSAMEVLSALLAKHSLSATRPQRSYMLHTIKTAKPGTIAQIGAGISLTFGQRDFIVKHPSKLLLL